MAEEKASKRGWIERQKAKRRAQAERTGDTQEKTGERPKGTYDPQDMADQAAQGRYLEALVGRSEPHSFRHERQAALLASQVWQHASQGSISLNRVDELARVGSGRRSAPA
jgi:hypothetical protein